MWSELFKFVLSQVITGIGVYFTYKSYKQANQKNQHSENDSKSISFMEPKNNSNPAEVISKQRKRIQKQIKTQQVLNLIPALIVLLYCAFVGYSLYNNLPIIQHSPLISFDERDTALSVILRIISNGFQTFGLFIYAFIILYSILFIIKYFFLQRPFRVVNTPIQILFCIATLLLTWNMFQVSLQVDLGNLFIKSIQNTQVTPLNDLLTILSTISPILILGQIVFSMWFFINLMRNFHTNQEFLTFNVKQDEFKNFIAFISLAYVIIYHTPI